MTENAIAMAIAISMVALAVVVTFCDAVYMEHKDAKKKTPPPPMPEPDPPIREKGHKFYIFGDHIATARHDISFKEFMRGDFILEYHGKYLQNPRAAKKLILSDFAL
jgi:hypothetical protein